MANSRIKTYFAENNSSSESHLGKATGGQAVGHASDTAARTIQMACQARKGATLGVPPELPVDWNRRGAMTYIERGKKMLINAIRP